VPTIIVAAKRTPIGAFMGSFSELSPVDLDTAAAKAVDWSNSHQNSHSPVV